MQISSSSLNGFQSLDSTCPDVAQVNMFTGNLVRSIQLFSIPTMGLPLEFTLYHNALDPERSGDMGVGWRHNFEMSLTGMEENRMQYADASGKVVEFEKSEGQWRVHASSEFQNSRLFELGEGLWDLIHEPDGSAIRFRQVSDSPMLARAKSRRDRRGNAVELLFDGSQLQEVHSPVGARSLFLGWEDGKVTTVTDPEGHTFTLTYTDGRMSSLAMPDGCLVEFEYDADSRIERRVDRDGADTVYHYDSSGRLTQIEGPEESSIRPSASWTYSDEPLHEVANLSPNGNPDGQFIELKQVLFHDARGKTWEYRFLASGMLWREISPMGRHSRYFYDDRQNLLYSSQGFPRKNLEDPNDTGIYDHPRDNANNQFRFNSFDSDGNLLETVDANGLATTMTYGAQSRLLSSYPGAAHYGLGGQWQEHFGEDGALFCALDGNVQDVLQAPEYLDEIVDGEGLVRLDAGFTLAQLGLLSNQVVGPSAFRRVGLWTSDGQEFSFEVRLNQARAFNLSLYTHSLDQVDGSGSSLNYPEFFGRQVEFQVTDRRGTQSYLVSQNAGGVWATFPVVGDEDSPVLVRCLSQMSEHRPGLAALTFDPFEDRRSLLSYDEEGFLVRATEPTSDPDRIVSSVFQYGGDGLLAQQRQELRVSGEIESDRATYFSYDDDARNLTVVVDPSNHFDHPVRMAYDGNANLVKVTDADDKDLLFQYDYRRRMTRIENGLGEVTQMSFDGRGLLQKVTDAKGGETSFLYTPSRRLWKISNALNEVTEFSYYPDGLLHAIQDPAGNSVSYQYDDDGQLVLVDYPESDIVLPNFDRQMLSPQLRMAYDAWARLVAVTSPNGNQSETDNINLVGALNILRNGGAEWEYGLGNGQPLGWQEDRPSGFVQGSVRSSSQKVAGGYAFPLTVPDSLEEGGGYDWVQRRPSGGPGGRYLMSGSARSNLETNARLRAVVRDFSSSLSEQSAQSTLPADTWTEVKGRLDLPGDAQISRTMPVLHQFRAGIEKPASGIAEASFDEMQVLALSQLTHYAGEYATGGTGADGARMQIFRDRFGRVRRIVDPISRSVTFRYDALDRVVQVTDSNGLSLRYVYDFLGNLISFIDSREMTTTFLYDFVNRVTAIYQPESSQFELFTYTLAGDLATYTNSRGQERQFLYDDAHRLVRIDYLRDPDPSESVLMQYDANGNLTRLTERNGDRLSMVYDKLNRLQSTSRASLDGPRWTLANQFDSRGNRIGLKTNLPVYGQAEYGESEYGEGPVTIFSAHYNALNQMDSLTDSASNTTEFAFDVEGRLAEVNHPVEDLQTRYRYDLVGKLLESRVALDGDELWKLNYGYNLAGERLSQHSVWEDGGNAFEYRLDASGRLIRESINRFVCDGVEDWVAGINYQTATGPEGQIRLLAREDDFSASYLDLQRWELVVSEPAATSVQVSPGQGLRWLTSSGGTLRNGRTLPGGAPIDSSNALNDYPHLEEGVQVSDTVGWFEGRMLLRHRTPLQGAFDIEVLVSEFDLFECSIGLGVTRDRFETADGGSRFPTDLGGAVDPNGCDIVVQKDGGLLTRFNNQVASGLFSVNKLRLKRFLDGSDWRLQAYYHDGEDWVTDVAWVGVVDDQELYAYLHLSGKVGYLRWSDFLDTVGDAYPTAGEYESRTYDAGRSVDWTRISWNEVLPAGTGVTFQVAVSEDADGPWTYGSALTTAAGTTITDTTGRYARFKLAMTGDGSDTPVVDDVQLTHDGTSGSRVTRWRYDDAGNITEQARVTDAGTETDTRTYNDLNQLTTSSGGWTYQYDLDGNLTEKNNGTAEDCEKWEYAWNENSRLVQVKKGVYDAAPVLVNEFTVDYQYDEMGRMLRRDDGTDVTDYFYDDWDIWKEVTGESVTEYLVPALGLQSFLRDVELYTLHPDGLGSSRTVTDSDGSVVARMEFGAMGEILSGSVDLVPGGLPTNFIGGLGVRRDPLTGLVCMRNRWYECSQGRFVSRDPIGLEGGSNLYAYSGFDPVNHVDPSGLQETCHELKPSGSYFGGIIGWLGRGMEANARMIGGPSGLFMPGGRFGLPSAFDNWRFHNSWADDDMKRIDTVVGIGSFVVGMGRPKPSSLSRAAGGVSVEQAATSLAERSKATLQSVAAAISRGLRNSRGPRGGRGGWARFADGRCPGKGLFELSANSRTASRFSNLSRKPMEFIFDGERFVMGNMKHEPMVRAAGMGEGNILGGTIWQQRGKIMTNEMSGSFHRNWNDQARQAFQAFMSENGVFIEHQTGF